MSEKVLLIHCSQLNEIAPIVTMGLWGIADGINKAGYRVEIVNTKVTPLLENDIGRLDSLQAKIQIT